MKGKEEIMKKWIMVPAVASMAMVGMFGCSSDSTDSKSPVAIEGVEGASGEIALVSASDAKAHMAMFRRSVVDSWQFESAESDSASTGVDSVLQNTNFAVDADVTVEDDSVYTVASAGVDGKGFAWMVQVENGAVVYSWRENAESEWQKFKTEKRIEKLEKNNIRVELAGKVVVIFVNGKIEGAFRNEKFGSFTMEGLFTVGFDKFDMGKCHCHNGHVEQVDVETVNEIEDTPIDSIEVVEPVETPIDTIAGGSNPVSETVWIAEWDFNDAENVGLDVTGNGHNATIGEGSVASTDGIAAFDGKSGFTVALADDIKINEFVVEARVKPTQFGTMQNIIVAEPPGRGVDGWQLRIDEGVLTVHLRDDDLNGDDWNIFPGKRMNLGEWNVIRMERSADSVKLFQNGELTVAAAYTGDLTQMRYDWSIGFDGMQQAFHNRYFIGEMDYVRFGAFNGFSAGVLPVKSKRLLVAWEFNEPTFIGLDRMANNSTHDLVGSLKVADTTVALDGRSGLEVGLSKVFQRNTFAIETRVKPTQFGEMQNIIVAEPPGRYGDGWIVRLDNGVLTVHFRDEDTDGITWNILRGEKLALDEWTDIRVERGAESIKVFQNGELTAEAETTGDISQLGYDIGIGFDAMRQAKHDRFFEGEIDFIRYYGL